MSNSLAILVRETPKAYHYQDQLWKTIIMDLFEEFLLYFVPKLHEKMDKDVPPEPLEQELLKISPVMLGKRIADKLFKIRLLDGEEQWVLVHIEVQGNNGQDFAKRMFESFYRIYDQRQHMICAIALFTNNHFSGGQDTFQYQFYGTELTYTYNTFNILDLNEGELWDTQNPFKFALLAGLYANKTGNNIDKRYEIKKKLFELLLKEKHEDPGSKAQKSLYFVDFLLEIPRDLTKKLKSEMISDLRKEEIKVESYAEMGVSPTIDEFGKSMKEEGIKEGAKRGFKEGQKEVTLEMLKEGISVDFIAKVTKLSKEEIKLLQNKL